MMKKRILALLLMVCMLLTLMPVGALAEEEETEEVVAALNEEGQDDGKDTEGGTAGGGVEGGTPEGGATGGSSEGGATGGTSEGGTTGGTSEGGTTGGTSEGGTTGGSSEGGTTGGSSEGGTIGGPSEGGTTGSGTEGGTTGGSESGSTKNCEHPSDKLSYRYTTDGKHAVHCEACDTDIREESCSSTKATCVAPSECTVCHHPYGEVNANNHTGNYEYVYNNDGTHTQKCKDCGKTVAENVKCTLDDSAKCTVCGATVDLGVDVSFTLTGYGVGKASKDVKVTSGNGKVTVKGVTVDPNDATFKEGTPYNFIITYDVETGYHVASATVNGAKAKVADTFVSVTMSSPESYYSISYDLDGGKLPTGKTNPTTYTKESGDITLVNPEKEGWDFAGWTGTGLTKAATTVTIPTGSSGDRSYAATWASKNFTVKFDLQGHGKAIKDQTVSSGNKVKTPTTPTASGYTFGGWYTDKECKSKYDFSTKVTSSFTLYAKWEEAYTLKFDTNGGNTLKSRSFAKGTSVDLRKYKPTRSGYYFVGWFRDSKLTKPVTWQEMSDTYAKDGVVTVHAKWKKMDTTNPKTGDTAFPELAAGLLTLSAVSLGAVTVIGKKKRNW